MNYTPARLVVAEHLAKASKFSSRVDNSASVQHIAFVTHIIELCNGDLNELINEDFVWNVFTNNKASKP